MLVEIDPSDPRPLYVQIMDEIKRALLLGTLGVGDPLPSVRQLASELRVNHNTIKQAYRELEHEGVVRAERGRGTYVAPGAEAPSEADRKAVARRVAEGAVREAIRNGISPDELVEAIRALRSRRTEGEEVERRG